MVRQTTRRRWLAPVVRLKGLTALGDAPERFKGSKTRRRGRLASRNWHRCHVARMNSRIGSIQRSIIATSPPGERNDRHAPRLSSRLPLKRFISHEPRVLDTVPLKGT